MANTITGRIDTIKRTETREYNDKTYYERTIVLDATRHDPYTGEPMYPNFPAFTFSGEDKCRELDSFNDGDVVTISFDIRGSKYADKNTGEEKVFNKVQGFKIEARIAQNTQRSANENPISVDSSQMSGDIDPLPF